MIKLSLDDLNKLYRLASIGKLVGGLIHNLNGPLQNMGLDIEMANLSLKDKSKWDQNTIQTIISRIGRMEEEHDKINALIRATLEKTEGRNAAGNISLSSINGFIREELAYLDANLYFKHNIQKEVIDINGSYSASDLPKDSLEALGWFLQCLAEELERQKVGGLTIKILSENSKLKIFFSTKGGVLSEDFIRKLKNNLSPVEATKPDDIDIGIFLAIIIFKTNGIRFEFDTEAPFSHLVINFP